MRRGRPAPEPLRPTQWPSPVGHRSAPCETHTRTHTHTHTRLGEMHARARTHTHTPMPGQLPVRHTHTHTHTPMPGRKALGGRIHRNRGAADKQTQRPLTSLPAGFRDTLSVCRRTSRLRAPEVSLEQVLWSRAPTEREGGPSYFCSQASPHRLCSPLPGRLGLPTH